MVKTR